MIRRRLGRTCESQGQVGQRVECAPLPGQLQAAFLTGILRFALLRRRDQRSAHDPLAVRRMHAFAVRLPRHGDAPFFISVRPARSAVSTGVERGPTIDPAQVKAVAAELALTGPVTVWRIAGRLGTSILAPHLQASLTSRISFHTSAPSRQCCGRCQWSTSWACAGPPTQRPTSNGNVRMRDHAISEFPDNRLHSRKAFLMAEEISLSSADMPAVCNVRNGETLRCSIL